MSKTPLLWLEAPAINTIPADTVEFYEYYVPAYDTLDPGTGLPFGPTLILPKAPNGLRRVVYFKARQNDVTLLMNLADFERSSLGYHPTGFRIPTNPTTGQLPPRMESGAAVYAVGSNSLLDGFLSVTIEGYRLDK
jgi:hypothetical protein